LRGISGEDLVKGLLVRVAVDPASVGRATAGRSGRLGVGVDVGEGGGSAPGDRVRSDRHADLSFGRWPCPRDLDESGTGCDAEHQPERQKRELARGHGRRPPRPALSGLRRDTLRAG
jgi:hypothetical protein